jgi:hypothetical protein
MVSIDDISDFEGYVTSSEGVERDGCYNSRCTIYLLVM